MFVILVPIILTLLQFSEGDLCLTLFQFLVRYFVVTFRIRYFHRTSISTTKTIRGSTSIFHSLLKLPLNLVGLYDFSLTILCKVYIHLPKRKNQRECVCVFVSVCISMYGLSTVNQSLTFKTSVSNIVRLETNGN